MRKQLTLFLALMVTLTGPVFAQSGPYDKLIVFGDSISDSGNLAALTGGQLLPAPYAGGRATNGPVWVEYLSANLDIPLINMAVVGARTGEGKNDPPPSIIALGVDPEDLQIPAVGKQISNYLLSDKPTENSLVVVWAGSNDIFFGAANNEESIRNISKHIRKLARNGAENFLIPNLPPLDRTPYGELVADPVTQAALEFLTIDFNIRLTNELNLLRAELGINITELDVHSLLSTAIDNPFLFGFADAQYPYLLLLTDPNLPFPLPEADYFLFWDDVHPTTAGHAVLAAEAEAVIENTLVP